MARAFFASCAALIVFLAAGGQADAQPQWAARRPATAGQAQTMPSAPLSRTAAPQPAARVLPAQPQPPQNAIGSLPLEELSSRSRGLLAPVLGSPSLSRRVGQTVIECDPELYVFLIRRPEVIVNIWQMMGATKATVQRISQYDFRVDDGAGAVCDVQLLYGDAHLHVLYVEGAYSGGLAPRPIKGRCVLALWTRYQPLADGRYRIGSDLDLYLKVDNVGADILARTFQPLIGRTAEHNFTESTRFVAQVSAAAEANAHGMQRLAGRLDNVHPDIRRQFSEITKQISRKAASRAEAPDLSAANPELPLDRELAELYARTRSVLKKRPGEPVPSATVAATAGPRNPLERLLVHLAAPELRAAPVVAATPAPVVAATPAPVVSATPAPVVAAAPGDSDARHAGYQPSSGWKSRREEQPASYGAEGPQRASPAIFSGRLPPEKGEILLRR